MKKLFPIILIGLVVCISSYSCKKTIAAIFGGADVSTPTISDTIPVIPYVLPAEVQLGSHTFNFNLDSNIRAKTAGAFGANSVNSLKLKQFVFTLKNADTANNIANLETARITLTSNANTTPAEIVNVSLPDSTQYSYTFNAGSNTPELLSYAKGTKLTYTFYGKVRRVTAKPLLFSVYAILRGN